MLRNIHFKITSDEDRGRISLTADLQYGEAPCQDRAALGLSLPADPGQLLVVALGEYVNVILSGRISPPHQFGRLNLTAARNDAPLQMRDRP